MNNESLENDKIQETDLASQHFTFVHFWLLQVKHNLKYSTTSLILGTEYKKQSYVVLKV